jgi:hypothetical protein
MVEIKGFDGLELSLYLEIKQRGYDNSTYKNSIPEPGNPEAPVKFAESVNK